MVDSYLSKTENRLCEVNPFLAQTLEITEEIANVSAVEFDNWDCEPTPLKKLSKSIQGKILHINYTQILCSLILGHLLVLYGNHIY